MSSIVTETRNADLLQIRDLLETQRTRRLDVVVRHDMISSQDGRLIVHPGESTQIVSDEGVTSAAGLYRPTSVGYESLGSLLDIHVGYLKALLAAGRTDLADANINGMLHGSLNADLLPDDLEPPFSPYGKGILLRLLKGDDDLDGVLRAALSPQYKIIDNLDVLLAVLQGVSAAGVNAIPDVCDLSDRRMYVRLVVPELAVLAPKLLDGYRSPFDGPNGVKRAGEGKDQGGGGGNADRPGMRLRADGGHSHWTVPQALLAAAREGQSYEPGQEPVVFAGLIISNSDTGGGARTIAPQIRIRACRNGLTLVAEADRKVHLGSRMEEGVVSWSAETMERELALITSQATDAVRTFLSPEWFGAKVAEIEELAGVPIPREQAEQVIREVTKAAGFREAEASDIWDHFLMGGQGTVGGLGNAITSVSQTVASPDRAAELDVKALPVMVAAAKAPAVLAAKAAAQAG